MTTPSVHACALVVGEAGVLIRGPSGAGKSLLTLATIRAARAEGCYAALVADDRVLLTAVSGRLLARCPARLASLIERRGVGLLAESYEPAAVLRLVVELTARGETPSRLPEDAEREVELMGVRLPRLALDLAPGVQEGAYAALRGLDRVTL